MTSPPRECRLRLARPADESLFLGWRNAPWSVALSGSQSTATLDEHHHWFAQSLEGTTRLLFVVEEFSQPVGMVRYEVAGEDALEITIAIIPEHVGEGLGTAAFVHSLPLVAGWRPMRKIRARVLRGNGRSLSFFRHLGFVIVEDDGTSRLVRLELAAGGS